MMSTTYLAKILLHNYIYAGVNPLEKSKLIGNFKSTNTAARVKKVKRVPRALTAASTISAMQTLPSKLKYDYERQVRRQEAQAVPHDYDMLRVDKFVIHLTR